MRERPARGPRARAARLPPAERRAQLLASALGVFARQGLGGARHADVAAAAHVSLPAVFHYFPSRDALVDAVLSEIERFYVEMMEAAIAGSGGDGRAALCAHARAFTETVRSQPDHARVWLDWSTAVRERPWRRYLAFHGRILRTVVATIRRGQRDGSIAPDVVPEDAGRVFIAAAYEVMQLELAGAPRARIDRFLESVVRAVTGRSGSAAAAR